MFTMVLVDYKTVFKEWINRVFLDFRGDTRLSVSDFARHIGISQQVMNGWLNYGSIPSAKYLSRLANIYPEVYEILGLPTPEVTINNIEYLPEAKQVQLTSALNEISRAVKEKGISRDSAEADKLSIEILAKYGITFTGKQS